jgi:hypothetical protein
MQFLFRNVYLNMLICIQTIRHEDSYLKTCELMLINLRVRKLMWIKFEALFLSNLKKMTI